jgi:hypothetical protein
MPRPTRRLQRRQVERINLRIGLAVGAGVVVGAATGWPVGAVLAALAGWGAPSLLGGARGAQAGVGRIEAVAGWAEMLRDTMAGAAGLEQTIVATAPLAPLPIRAEVATLALRLQGERLAPALRCFADEVADPTCDLVVAALILAAEQAARDQATMRLRVEAGRARVRTSVKVIVGATGGLILALAVLNRGYLTPYDTAVGQLVLVLVGGLFAAAFFWLARMTRPASVDRFLSTGPEVDVPRRASERLA